MQEQFLLFPPTSHQQIIHGDCLEVMRTMADNSIDFVVTDPPYGLHFMGKDWDQFKHYQMDSRYVQTSRGIEKMRKGQPPNQLAGTYNEKRNDEFQEFIHKVGIEMLRLLKPGGMLAMFGAPRRHHRQMSALEDAGFEIRDCIAWVFGQGFPKSHNFGKKMGGEWSGYGTALKPAYEPILICKKPYEINHLFGIILLDLTKEIYQCQKSNYNVSDAESNSNDSLQLLNRVHQSIAQENVKMFAWEKLADVQYVIKNGMFLAQELREQINQEKEFFAHTHAKQNGSLEEMQARTILSGEAECIFASIQDIVIFATKEHTELNIALLWKHILIGIYQGLNKFTIRTVINLITELRILKSCLHPSISKDIGNLSPNYEPIILAMKPLDGTFQQNAEKWGIGGINIDESRIGTEQTTTCISGGKGFGSNFRDDNWEPPIESYKIENKGRWPANIIFDEISAELLDQQTGILKSPGSGIRRPNAKNSSDEIIPNSYLPPDSGGASRFFYCAKASRAERQGSIHPTMKPIALMKYVIKLLAPPSNPTLLDPFAGSGSTLIAAAELGINAIGIEKEKEYCDIAENRLKHVN